MLNQYPWWKYLIIVFITGLGLFYALPNLYQEDPAVQITGASTAVSIDPQLIKQIESTLLQANIPFKSVTSDAENHQVLVRLDRLQDQLKARTLIQQTIGARYIAALNMSSTVPAWLRSFGAQSMKLGLDLRGGVYFLLEVDMDATLQQRFAVHLSSIKSVLRKERLRYKNLTMTEGTLAGQKPTQVVRMVFATEVLRNQAKTLLRDAIPEFSSAEGKTQQDFYLDLGFLEQEVQRIKDYAMEQNLTTLRNRVNELGVAEPLIQRQGSNRIVVQLPGVQDSAAAKRILGTTANLEFRLEANPDTSSLAKEILSFRNRSYRKAELERDIIIVGDNIINAASGYDQNGRPQVQVRLDGVGGQNMYRITREAVGRNMGVVFIEHKSRSVYTSPSAIGNDAGATTKATEALPEKIPETTQRYIQKSIISLATIQSPLNNQFVITGLDSQAEAAELALLLRAGALAAPVYFVQERTIGPSLGKDNIAAGLFSIQMGLLLIFIFMLLYYKVFGFIANLALLVNLLMVVAAMSVLSATLTLPGIAGLVLTVGMSVDANVLIFSRIREELKSGSSVQQAISKGYDRAFITILDANITTLLIALIMFVVGTGPIKGFAITLSLGIITSLFTAIMLTRSLVNLIYGARKVKRLLI